MSTDTNERNGYKGWAIVQQMGHVTIAGYVTETMLAGHGVLSVAIPDGDRTIEKLIPPSTLYDLTWVGEAEARSVAKKHPAQVIDDWTIRQEIRERIETEEKGRIEQRAKLDAEQEYQARAREDRDRVLDILSDAKAVAKVVSDNSPIDEMMSVSAQQLMASIATWCGESDQLLRGEQPVARTYAGGGYDDDPNDGDDTWDDDEDPD